VWRQLGTPRRRSKGGVKTGVKIWIELIWLRIEASGGLLWRT